MRESIRDLGRLQHIVENIDRVEEFVTGKTLVDLQSDAMLRYASPANRSVHQRIIIN